MQTKKLLRKIRNFEISEGLVYKTFLIIFASIVFFLLYINQMTISFLTNNFSSVFSADVQVYGIYVGQGDSSLVILPDKTSILIDTGTETYAENLCYQVEAILKANGKEEIDYLIITHANSDHYGGVTEVLRRFKVNNIFRPKIAVPTEFSSYVVSTDADYIEAIEACLNEDCNMFFVTPSTINLNPGVLTFWTPTEDEYYDSNDYSPIMTIESAGKTLMFTGDATSQGEEEFLEVAESIDFEVDILKVAHHGSATSTSESFLEKVNPKYALICAGFDNSYNFPTQEVVTRLMNAGVRAIYNTNDLGTIGLGLFDNTLISSHSFFFFDKPFYLVAYLVSVFAIWEIRFKIKHKFSRRKEN